MTCGTVLCACCTIPRTHLSENRTAQWLDATVWAYGSRVTGTPGPMSDLDLVVRHRDDPLQRVAGVALLAQALSDSTIPIPIDVRQWAGLPAAFHDEILRGYVVLV